VLLAHYLLGHNIGGNYQNDRTRRMLYWHAGQRLADLRRIVRRQGLEPRTR